MAAAIPHVDLVANPFDAPPTQDNGCPACGGHTMALGSCLLALTLLVLSWWFAPPRSRLALQTLWRPAPVPAMVGRRVPSLSLAELSILRT